MCHADCRRRLSRAWEIWLFTEKERREKETEVGEGKNACHCVHSNTRVQQTKWNNTHTYAISRVQRTGSVRARKGVRGRIIFSLREDICFSIFRFIPSSARYIISYYTYDPNFMVTWTHCAETHTTTHTPPAVGTVLSVILGSPFILFFFYYYLFVVIHFTSTPIRDDSRRCQCGDSHLMCEHKITDGSRHSDRET